LNGSRNNNKSCAKKEKGWLGQEWNLEGKMPAIPYLKNNRICIDGEFVSFVPGYC